MIKSPCTVFFIFVRYFYNIISLRINVALYIWAFTFSPEAPVRTNVENTGREYFVREGQHSMDAPIGRQKRGTDSGKGKDS